MRPLTALLLPILLVACGDQGGKSPSEWYQEGVQAEIALHWNDAATAFEGARDYLDATNKAAHAHEQLARCIASYDRGRRLEAEGHPWHACEAYSTARDLMPGYQDATARAGALLTHVTEAFADGHRLLEAGDLPAAEARYRAADGFRDAERIASECATLIAEANREIRTARAQLEAGDLQGALRSRIGARQAWPRAPDLEGLSRELSAALRESTEAAARLAAQKATDAETAHRAALAQAEEAKRTGLLSSAGESEARGRIGSALRALGAAIDAGLDDGRLSAEATRLTQLAETAMADARRFEEQLSFESAARQYARLGDYGDAHGGAERCEQLARSIAARQTEIATARREADWSRALTVADQLRPLLRPSEAKSTLDVVITEARIATDSAMRAGRFRTAAQALEALARVLPADADLAIRFEVCQNEMKAWEGRHRYEIEVVLDLASPGWSRNDDWASGAGKPELYIEVSKDEKPWLTTKRQFRQDSATGSWTLETTLEGEAAWSVTIGDKDWMRDDSLWGFTIKSGILMYAPEVVVSARELGASEWGDSRVRIRRLDGVKAKK